MTAPTSVSRTRLALGGKRRWVPETGLEVMGLDMLRGGYVSGLVDLWLVKNQALAPEGCTVTLP